MVAMIRQRVGTRTASVCGGVSAPAGTSDRYDEWPTRLKGNVTGWLAKMVKSGPNALSKSARFISSMINHRPFGRVVVPADGLADVPVRGGGRGQVAVAAHRPLGQLGHEEGEGGLARAGCTREHDVLARVECGHQGRQHVAGEDQAS